MYRKLFICILIFLSGQLLSHPSYGIEVDKQGNIYFADITHYGRGTVWKMDIAGKVSPILKDFHAHNVNKDTEGNIYVAHGEVTQMLIRINDSSSFDTLFFSKHLEEFFGGNCTVSPNGVIYFGIDHYIWKLDKKGHVTKASEFYLEWNQGFYVDEQEDIYATDIGNGNGSLYLLRKNGSSTLIADQLITLTNGRFDPHADVLLGVKKGPDDHIYLADIAGGVIKRISLSGNVTTHYQSDDGWIPTGIAFNRDQEYVLEYGRNKKGPRITRVPMGNKEIIFEYGNQSIENHSLGPGKNYFLAGIALLLISLTYFLVPGELSTREFEL